MEEPEIIYEDSHLLVASKPPSLATQPAAGLLSLEEVVKAFIKERDRKTGAVFLHAIFRLDRPVRGLVLFAKSSKALKRLHESQRQRQYVKEYEAIVHHKIGVPLLVPGMYTDFLMKGSFQAKISREEAPGAKKSEMEILSFEPLQERDLCRVRLRLHTGRYHQIRLQLSSRGFPILGDVRYGGKAMEFSGQLFSEDAIALCHTSLSFLHPVQDTCGNHAMICLHVSKKF